MRLSTRLVPWFLCAFWFFLFSPSTTASRPQPPQEGGHVLWRFEIPSTVSGSHVGVGADGRVYTTSFNPPNLYALAPDGSLLWSVSIGSSGYWPISFGADGTIYTGAGPGVRAVNPDGTLRWAFDTGSFGILAGPNIGPDGNIYVSDDGLGFLSLDQGGSLRWSNPGSPLASGLYFDADEIVFGDGRLFGGVHFLRSGPWIGTYAFDLDGHQLWFRSYGSDGGPSSNPRLLPDGRLAFRWGQGSLALIHPSGVDDWVEPHPDGAQVLVTPAVGPDGTIYTGDQYGVQLLSANPDGTIRWVRGIANEETLSRLGVSPDNRVLIASGSTYSQSEGVNHGWIRGYAPASGDLLWQTDLELEQGLSQITRTVRPAFSSNGDMAYLTTWFAGDGVGHTYLYAISLRQPTTGVPTEGPRGLDGPRLSFSPNPCFAPAQILLGTTTGGPASVRIYDVTGREVRRLFEGSITSPGLRLEWDLRDEWKQAVDSGVYLVSAHTPDGTSTTRVVLVR